MKDVASEIRRWFREHENGEFVQMGPLCPYSITSPTSRTDHVLYTTKPACVLAALEKGRPSTLIQVIGRAGLPDENGAAWLRNLADNRPVVFMGDADPADLLVFAWLRSQMSVSYVGLSDMLVQKLRDQTDHALTIPLSDSEREAMSLVAEVFPEYKTSVGQRCADYLNQGRKVEIEVVVHLARDGVALEPSFRRSAP